MKNRFLYIAFMIALTINSSMGMDLSNTKEFSQWEFKGDFQEIKEYFFCNAPMNREFIAFNKNNVDYIKSVRLFGLISGKVAILIQYNPENVKCAPINLSQKMQNIGALDEDYNIWVSLACRGEIFLYHFYNYNLISDFVMERLLQELNWEDFRLKPSILERIYTERKDEIERKLELEDLTINAPRILEMIEKEKKDDSEEEFKRLLHPKLLLIQEEKNRQRIAFYIMKSLSENWKNLILDLATSYIKNPHFFGYSTTQLVVSQILFARGDGYEQAILPLLSIKEWDEERENELNILVKHMLSQGKISSNLLAKELLNLKLSPEKLLNMLLFVFRQQQYIESLENENSNLKNK